MAVCDFATCPSLVAMFFEQAARLGDKPLVWRKIQQSWTPLTWTEVADQVNLLARGLLELGLKVGDRVVLVAENRPEWLIADLAIMSAGGITVPGYTTNTVADHVHLLNNSAARMAIASTRALTERLLAASGSADCPPIIVSLDPPPVMQQAAGEMHGWADVLTTGAKRNDDIAARVAALRPADTACIIYTSGTGGAPRGVMLSHGAILCNCDGAHDLLLTCGLTDEVFLSFLPLSHAYEHTAGQFFPLSIGAQIFYAEAVELLASDLTTVHPTIMIAVPRLYEVFRQKILASVDRKGGISAALFHRAVRLGTKRYEDPHSLSPFERAENVLLDRLVRRKVATRFGGRLKCFVSGGGPLNYEVGVFFLALGMTILQGYGQTEAAPVVSCNRRDNIKTRTVGPPLKGVEVRIADDGEILVRGRLVMQGYWRDDEATRNALRDGWLHTGDIGVIDEGGLIRITDRKKDIIVVSGGDNISPQRVEGFLTLRPEIAQAMVHGDRHAYLVALIVPDAEWAATWAAAQGKPADLPTLLADSAFRSQIAAAVNEVGSGLSSIEKVRRFVLTDELFSVTNGMLTPTMKIRRHVIRERYGAALEELYEERKGRS